METIKKILGATFTVFLLMTLIFKSLSAQEMPSIAVFDNFTTTSKEGKLTISWSSFNHKDAQYFIIEKLDENWDFQNVGKVSADPGHVIYSIEDDQPLEGENYYRITVVIQEDKMLQSELLVADYFEPAPSINFLPEVSNSMIARSLIEKSLKNSDLVNPKYSSSQLTLNRMMLTKNIKTSNSKFISNSR